MRLFLIGNYRSIQDHSNSFKQPYGWRSQPVLFWKISALEFKAKFQENNHGYLTRVRVSVKLLARHVFRTPSNI